MKLYILRHGETDKNKERVLQGRLNTSLNEMGRKQAIGISDELKNILFDEIYVSPLNRAIETAELATGISRDKFILEDRMIEISFGKMEGRSVDSPEGNLAKFFKAPQEYIAEEGAESFEELLKRVDDFLLELKEKYKEKDVNILLVSHGAWIHAVIMLIKKCPLNDFWKAKVANCAVTEVVLENSEYRIEKESDIEERRYVK